MKFGLLQELAAAAAMLIYSVLKHGQSLLERKVLIL
jgi:hypothetical protein